VGDTFSFDGVNYTTTAHFDDPSTDLRIWQVSGTFPTWAPLYTESNEVGRTLVVFGRGLVRGAAVVTNSLLNGWEWSGSPGGSLRWGENSVYAVVDGGSYGSLLYALFESSANPNEADLALGDSSGPVFIDDGTGWKLAGIALAVDGPFNTTNTGSGFDAAIFDARGLYIQDGSTWELITGTEPVPTGFYATQVSARAAWINSIIQPANGTDSPLLTGPLTIVLALAMLGIGAFYLRRPAV
jgi:hypothetical protein